MKTIDASLQSDNNILKNGSLYIVGSTGSGKSTLIHGLIEKLMKNFTYKDLQFVLVDLKQTEFDCYKNLPYLYNNQIITDEKQFFDIVLKLGGILQNRRAENLAKSMQIYLIVDEYYGGGDKDSPLQDDKQKKIFEKTLLEIFKYGQEVGISCILASQVSIDFLEEDRVKKKSVEKIINL